MRNKSLLLKLCTMAIAISGFGISFSSATLFHLEVNTGGLSAAEIAVMKNDIKNKLMPVHFADNGNDFGGFFYFTNGLTGTNSTSTNVVTIANELSGFDCDNQVRGYYYNAERGERLRPLDEDTKDTRKDLNNSQGNLTLTGGIYTVCTVSGYNKALTDCGTAETTTGYEECIDGVRQQYKADDNGYYGYIEHEYSGQTMALVAGVDYDNFNRPNDFVTISGTSKFSPTFIRYLNQNPVGFIYDYNGGVGLVGCKFKRPPSDSVKRVMQNLYNPGPANLKNIFFVTGDKIEVLSPYGTYIDCSGSNAVWSPVLSLIIEGIIGLADEQKVGYIGTQKDDKMQYFSSASINNNTLINYAKKKAEILCRGRWNCNTSDSIVCCDRSITPTDKSKIYVVKNGNVTISPETNCDFNTNGYYNVVIVNGGNLIINESVGSKKCVFGGDGFLMGSSNTPEAFASAVSGDALNGQDYDLRAGAAVGSYIKGNFIVDGYITGNNSDLKNKYFIYGKLTTQDDYKTLLSTFSWRCNYGLSTEEADGTKNFCPNSLYQGAPLTVIDQNYPSPFYNS